jgi:hypothetical protein
MHFETLESVRSRESAKSIGRRKKNLEEDDNEEILERERERDGGDL